MADISVNVVKNGNDYFLAVKEGKKEAKIPLEDCKSAEEAEMSKQGFLVELAKIDKAQVAKGIPNDKIGNKIDKVA